MATQKTLVTIVHDEGYGGDLITHINLAFRGKDMRAEKQRPDELAALRAERDELREGLEAFVRAMRASDGPNYLDLVVSLPAADKALARKAVG